MIELKSVRVRKLTNGSNSGLLDLKVTVYGLTSSNTQRKVTAVIPSSGQSYWQETEFSGPRYDAKTNDEIISEFISANSSREKTRLGLPESKTLFKILQDPWEEKNPILRNYGDDPYYLNNGSAIKIEWKKKLPISYSFNSEYLYNNGTNSTPTHILVIGDVFFDGKKPSDIEVDFPNQFRLFYNPASFSLTSSVVDANLESTTMGFSSGFANKNYVLSLEIENDTPTLQQNVVVFPPVGPTEIFQDVSGYEYSDSNLKEINTPKDIIKQVIIIPKRISAIDETGEFIEEKRRWSFDENLKPDYTHNLQSQPGSPFSQFYKFEGVNDDVIISKTIETWVKELSLAYPIAKDYGLKLATPDYVPPTTGLIPDYSPLNGWGLLGGVDIYPDGTKFKFQQVGTSSNLPLLSSSASSVSDSATASQISKLKLLTQFPDNWIIKADEKAPPFSLWIGEIQSDVAPEGYIYSEETDEMSNISPEYLEESFAGLEEETPEFLQEVVSDLQDSKSSVQSYDPGTVDPQASPSPETTTGYADPKVVKVPIGSKAYSHTAEQGYNLTNSQWYGNLLVSAKAHIEHPTFDIEGTESGNLGCASWVSMVFYRAFGLSMIDGKPVKKIPKKIEDFGSKGTADLGQVFPKNPSLWQQIPYLEGQPGDIINTERNFATNKAGHIGVVIDEKHKDGSWVVASNSSAGFGNSSDPRGCGKKNYSVKKWSKVADRNPTRTFCWRWKGSKLPFGKNEF